MLNKNAPAFVADNQNGLTKFEYCAIECMKTSMSRYSPSEYRRAAQNAIECARVLFEELDKEP